MAVVNIAVSNDADFYCTFQYKTVDGDPIDITGGIMYMMMRRHAEDEAVLMRLGTDTGEIVLVDPVQGKFTVRIVQEELERLGLGDYAHSLILTGIGGQKRGIWYGTFTNNAGPSR